MNKQDIIDKIISDAEASAKETMAAAREKLDARLATLKTQLVRYESAQKVKADQEGVELIQRSATVDGLDARKTLLGAKQAVIERVLTDAAQEICETDQKRYMEWIASLLNRYLEDGDEVVIAARDEKRLTDDIVAKMIAKTGKKATVAKARGAFSGGVMLLGAAYDKNLTVESALQSRRAELASSVNRIVFGD